MGLEKISYLYRTLVRNHSIKYRSFVILSEVISLIRYIFIYNIRSSS